MNRVKKHVAHSLCRIGQRMDPNFGFGRFESITVTTHLPTTWPGQPAPQPTPDYVDIRFQNGRRVFGYVDSAELQGTQ